jgi:hypothetical protein
MRDERRCAARDEARLRRGGMRIENEGFVAAATQRHGGGGLKRAKCLCLISMGQKRKNAKLFRRRSGLYANKEVSSIRQFVGLQQIVRSQGDRFPKRTLAGKYLSDCSGLYADCKSSRDTPALAIHCTN